MLHDHYGHQFASCTVVLQNGGSVFYVVLSFFLPVPISCTAPQPNSIGVTNEQTLPPLLNVRFAEMPRKNIEARCVTR